MRKISRLLSFPSLQLTWRLFALWRHTPFRRNTLRRRADYGVVAPEERVGPFLQTGQARLHRDVYIPRFSNQQCSGLACGCEFLSSRTIPAWLGCRGCAPSISPVVAPPLPESSPGTSTPVTPTKGTGEASRDQSCWVPLPARLTNLEPANGEKRKILTTCIKRERNRSLSFSSVPNTATL